MPMYAYRCFKCGNEIERFRSIEDREKPVWADCYCNNTAGRGKSKFVYTIKINPNSERYRYNDK